MIIRIYSAKEYPKSDTKTLVLVYFEYWQQHKDFLLLLKENELLILVLQNFLPNVKERLADRHQNDIDLEMTQYIFYFVSGGLWNLLVKWVEDGAERSPTEMSEMTDLIIDHIR